MNFILNDHKTGFTVSSKISDDINSLSGKKIEKRTFYKFWNLNEQSDKYVCFVRNPYEIIVSGFLYHKKCKEEWCINSNSSYYDWWQDHHFLDSQKLINKSVLKSSVFYNDKTYQEILNSSSTDEGILFEMKNISKLTIDGMCEFDFYKNENVITVKMEDLLSDYHSQIIKILKFLDIEEKPGLLNRLQQHNLTNSGINPHITNTKLKKNRYLDFFNDKLFKEFLCLHEKNLSAIDSLGYDLHC